MIECSQKLEIWVKSIMFLCTLNYTVRLISIFHKTSYNLFLYCYPKFHDIRKNVYIYILSIKSVKQEQIYIDLIKSIKPKCVHPHIHIFVYVRNKIENDITLAKLNHGNIFGQFCIISARALISKQII